MTVMALIASNDNFIYLIFMRIKAKPNYVAIPVYDINVVSQTGSNSYYDILRYLPFCNAKNDDIAAVVTDSSMAPIIDANSVVLLRRCLEFKVGLNNNKPHLIVLNDGRRYIRTLVENVSDDSVFLCKASNRDFDDIEIKKSKINLIYMVLAVYSDSIY